MVWHCSLAAQGEAPQNTSPLKVNYCDELDLGTQEQANQAREASGQSASTSDDHMPELPPKRKPRQRNSRQLSKFEIEELVDPSKLGPRAKERLKREAKERTEHLRALASLPQRLEELYAVDTDYTAQDAEYRHRMLGYTDDDIAQLRRIRPLARFNHFHHWLSSAAVVQRDDLAARLKAVRREIAQLACVPVDDPFKGPKTSKPSSPSLSLTNEIALLKKVVAADEARLERMRTARLSLRIRRPALKRKEGARHATESVPGVLSVLGLGLHRRGGGRSHVEHRTVSAARVRFEGGSDEYVFQVDKEEQGAKLHSSSPNRRSAQASALSTRRVHTQGCAVFTLFLPSNKQLLCQPSAATPSQANSSADKRVRSRSAINERPVTVAEAHVKMDSMRHNQRSANNLWAGSGGLSGSARICEPACPAGRQPEELVVDQSAQRADSDGLLGRVESLKAICSISHQCEGSQSVELAVDKLSLAQGACERPTIAPGKPNWDRVGSSQSHHEELGTRNCMLLPAEKGLSPANSVPALDENTLPLFDLAVRGQGSPPEPYQVALRDSPLWLPRSSVTAGLAGGRSLLNSADHKVTRSQATASYSHSQGVGICF